MRNGMADTVAEAEAQTFTLPSLDGWRMLAAMLDGYTIAKELGFDVMRWAGEMFQLHKTGRWNQDLDVLHLRLLLFALYRSDYMTGYTYHEYDEQVDSLLRVLSEKTGLPYSRE